MKVLLSAALANIKHLQLVCDANHAGRLDVIRSYLESVSPDQVKKLEPPPCIPFFDDVNRAKHYNIHSSGIECIQVVEHMNFNLGNVVKYVWRTDDKDTALENLKKGQWYLNREIERLEKQLDTKIIKK